MDSDPPARMAMPSKVQRMAIPSRTTRYGGRQKGRRGAKKISFQQLSSEPKSTVKQRATIVSSLSRSTKNPKNIRVVQNKSRVVQITLPTYDTFLGAKKSDLAHTRLITDIDQIPELDISGISLSPIDIDELSKVAFLVTKDADLSDSRLGYVSNISKCQTCMYKKTMCTGHLGIIRFEKYINHPNSIGLIERVLSCLCWTCNRLIVTIQEMVDADIIRLKEDGDPRDPRAYSYKHVGKKHIDAIVLLAKTREHCHSCSAAKTSEIVNETDDPLNTKIDPESGKPKMSYLKKMNFASSSSSKDSTSSGVAGEIFFSSGTKESGDNILTKGAILPSDHIYDRFKYMTDDDIYYLGFRGRSHPKNLIMKGIVVIPKRDRPKITTGGSIDELTRAYQNIIKANNTLKISSSTFASASDTTAIQGIITATGQLKMWVRRLISIKSSQDSRSQTKASISEMMISKTGTIRDTLAAMRTNFSGRTVIVPDPNLNINQVGIPTSFAKVMTKKVAVTTENIVYLQSLVNSDQVDYISVRVESKLGSKEWMFLRNIKLRTGTHRTIKAGDVVYRHLQNGDWVILSRQPLLHRFSRMAHQVVLVEGLAVRVPLEVTGAYNADYDGDEMNVNVPQEVSDEAIGKISVRACIMSGKNVAPIIGPVYDAPNAMYLLTGGWARIKKREFIQLNELKNAFTLLQVPFPINEGDKRIKRVAKQSEPGARPDISSGVIVDLQISMVDTLIICNKLISSLSGNPKKVNQAWNLLGPILINQNDYMLDAEDFMMISNRFYLNVEADYLYGKMSKADAAVKREEEFNGLEEKMDRVLRRAIKWGVLPKPIMHNSVTIDDEGLPVNILLGIRQSRKRFESEGASVHAEEIAWKIPGRVLFSLILPEDFSYRKNNVVIINGLLVSGTLTASVIGPKRSSIIHFLGTEYADNNWTAMRYIDNASRLSNAFISLHGITIGVRDCAVPAEVREEAKDARMEALYKLYSDIYTRGKESTDPDEIGREEARKVAYLTSTQALMKSMAGDENMIRHLRQSGAKGGLFNEQFMLSWIGQQLIDGMRIGANYGEEGDRSSAYVKPGETAIEARGYCTRNFGEGISETEFIAMQLAGRVALVSTAVMTGETGAVARTLAKALESIVQDLRGGAISAATQSIYQLCYGNVALYPGRMVFDQFPEESVASFIDFVRASDDFNMEWKDVPMRYLDTYVVDEIIRRFSPVIPSVIEEHSIMLTKELNERLRLRLLLFKSRVDVNNSDEFIDMIVTKMVVGYNIARMDLGVPVGLRAAENVAEPATQMTLSTFHTAGSAGSVGFEQILELIQYKEIKKPVTTLLFKPSKVIGDEDTDSDINVITVLGQKWRFLSFDNIYDTRKDFRLFTIDKLITLIETINYDGVSMIEDGHLSAGEQEYVSITGDGDRLSQLQWYYKIDFNLRLMNIYEIDVNDVIQLMTQNVEGDAYIFVTGYQEDGVVKVFVDTEKLATDINVEREIVNALSVTIVSDFVDLMKSAISGWRESVGDIKMSSSNIISITVHDMMDTATTDSIKTMISAVLAASGDATYTGIDINRVDGTIIVGVDTTSKIPDIRTRIVAKMVAQDFTENFEAVLRKSTLRGYEGIGEVFTEKSGIISVFTGTRLVDGTSNQWRVFIDLPKAYRLGAGWLHLARPFALLGIEVASYKFADHIELEEEMLLASEMIVVSDTNPLDMLSEATTDEIREALTIRHIEMNGLNDEVFSRDDISISFSTTNNVPYTEQMYGVVAARNHMMDKLSKLLSDNTGYIHPVHVQLMVDWMAYPGMMSPYIEKGFKNHGNDIDPVARAMFARGLDVFQNSANYGIDASTDTHSTALAVGQYPAIGPRYEAIRTSRIRKGEIPRETRPFRKSKATDVDYPDEDEYSGDYPGDYDEDEFKSEADAMDDTINSVWNNIFGVDDVDGGGKDWDANDVQASTDRDINAAGDEDGTGNALSGYVFSGASTTYNFNDEEDSMGVGTGDAGTGNVPVLDQKPVIYHPPTGLEVGSMNLVKIEPKMSKSQLGAFLGAFKKGESSSVCVRRKKSKLRRKGKKGRRKRVIEA